MWRPRCEEHGVERCRHPSCWLKTKYCSASHDSSCSASQPEACYPWLHELIDIRCKTASDDLFPQWKNLFSLFLSTNLLERSHSCVPSHIVSRENPCCVSDRPRKHWVCCHCKRRDLSLITARYVPASPRTVETAFSAAPLL